MTRLAPPLLQKKSALAGGVTGISTTLRATVLTVALFFLYSFPVVYNLCVAPFFTPLPSADLVPSSLLPLSLLSDGDLYLDEFSGFIHDNWGKDAYFVREVNGHLVSAYPVMVSFLAIPVYVLPVALRWISNPEDAYYVARVAASLLTAVSAGFFYLAARELTRDRIALTVALIYGVGTSAWTTASQGLWQHTATLFLLNVGLYLLLLGRRKPPLLAASGFFLGSTLLARYNNLPTLLLLAAYVWLLHRRTFLPYALCVLAPLPLLVVYNMAVLGSPLALSYGPSMLEGWTASWKDSLPGLLFSPAVGLFVYSPFFLFTLASLRGIWRDRWHSFLFYAALAVLCTLLVTGKWWAWYGGTSWGYRMLTDVVPFLCLLIVPALERGSKTTFAILGVCTIWAVFVHALGLPDYGLSWHSRYDQGGGDIGWLWQVKHSPIPEYTWHYAHRLIQLPDFWAVICRLLGCQP